MKRPTIADLARHSDVSVSTVNRLLHGRGSVRPETVERILLAAEEIGFYGLGALKERKKENLPQFTLGFLMQQSHRPLYRMWADGIRTAAARYPGAMIHPEVRFEDTLSPEAVAESLLKLGKEADAVSIITADHPLVSQAIDELHEAGVPVITYVTDLSAASRAGFVGTDNWKRGRTAAWFLNLVTEHSTELTMLVGNNRYQCQDMADASFRSYIREHAPQRRVGDSLLTHEEPRNAFEVTRQLLADRPGMQGIFVNGGGISGVLEAVRELPAQRRNEIRIISSDIGPETRKGLNEGLITASLCHPVERMSNELVDVMLKLLERSQSPSVEQRIVPIEIVTPESIWN